MLKQENWVTSQKEQWSKFGQVLGHHSQSLPQPRSAIAKDAIYLYSWLDPSAADLRRRRQPGSFGAAASRKTDCAPPSQLKLSAAAAAAIFTARRGL